MAHRKGERAIERRERENERSPEKIPKTRDNTATPRHSDRLSRSPRGTGHSKATDVSPGFGSLQGGDIPGVALAISHTIPTEPQHK